MTHLLRQKCAQIDPQTPKIARLLLSVTKYCTRGTALPTKLGDDHGGRSYDLHLLLICHCRHGHRHINRHNHNRRFLPLLLPRSGRFLSGLSAAAASVSATLPAPPLLMLSANTITTVSNTATAAPTPSVLHSHHQYLMFCCRHRFVSVSTAHCQRVCRRHCRHCLYSVANAPLLKLTEVQ